MKKFLMTTALVGFAAGAAQADDVPLGIIFGFTGPLESITPTMAQAAEAAIAEATRIERNRQWREANAAALHAYAQEVEDEGLPLAGYRSF